MLYDGLTEVRFIEEKGGNYTWVDVNNNGQVDNNMEEEFVLSANGSYRKANITDTLQEIEWTSKTWFWLLMAVLFMLLRDMGYIIRIRVLTDKKLSWKRATWVIFMWEFASALSPGIVGGSAVAMIFLKREKIPLGKSTAIVMITAFLDNLFYIIMVPLVLIFVSQEDLFPSDSGSAFTSNTQTIFWIGFGVVFLVCLLLYLSIFHFPKLIKVLLKSFFSLPILNRWKQAAIETGDEVITTSTEFKGKPFGYWLKSFGGTFLSWFSRFAVVNCVLMVFLNLSFAENMLVYARQFVMWLILLVTPTPGGSGMAEYAFQGFLGEFVTSSLIITAMAILWRIVSYYPYLFIGSGLLSRWRKEEQ